MKRARAGGSKLARGMATGLALLVCALSGCRHGVKAFGDDEGFPDTLSQWGLFQGRLADLQPNEGVLGYELNTPLFSDYAAKQRFVWMPAGHAARYRDNDVFEFPVGSILSKTFSYPDVTRAGKQRLIETRLLVRTRSGWYPLPYVWNREQTEARLEMAADPVMVSFQEASGAIRTFEYAIPNANQCKGCHEKAKAMTPLGPKARNLNRGGQLVRWQQAGYLAGAPDIAHMPRAAVWNDPATGTLDARARAYLDVNCAHCHNPEGPANTSGLYLTWGQADPLRLGFHKVPVSAGNGSGGLLFDVVARHPEQSILIHRMESAEPKVMMPELGRTLVHEEGVALIREWIRSRS